MAASGPGLAGVSGRSGNEKSCDTHNAANCSLLSSELAAGVIAFMGANTPRPM